MAKAAKKLAREDWARHPLADVKPFWQGRAEGTDIGADVTILFFTTDEVGDGPKLHVHTYDEIFVIREGRALFTVGNEKIEAGAGDVVFGPANVPHKFHNKGPGRLETTDIHLSPRFEQVMVYDPELTEE